MTEVQANEMKALIDGMLSELGEHFDAVQILVSTHDPEGTEAFARGLGNWYARQGMAREFVERATA